MAYEEFYQRDEDFEDQPPVFHDADGSPVYEGPYYALLCRIIHYNDVTALHSYNNSHLRVFRRSYKEDPSQNPFWIALGSRSFDALRALVGIYLSDPSLTEPLQVYNNRCDLSLVHQTCATGNQEMVEWLINHEPPLGSLHDRDTQGRTPLLYAAEALGEAGNLMVGAEPGETHILAREKARENRERLEKFIYWLLDSGCSVPESNTFENYDKSLPEGSENVSQIRFTVLGKAIPSASYEMVSHLITKGGGVHTPQAWSAQLTGIEYGWNVTPLHIASLFWNLEGIQALIDHRGDIELNHMVSQADSEDRLPLHWALIGIEDRREERDNMDEIISRMTSTIKLLLDAKPETINTRDLHGSTTFHYAAKQFTGHVALTRAVQMLLDAHPSLDTLNFRNRRGATAVGDMIQTYKFSDCTLEQIIAPIMALLENGADAHSCDNKGRNVLHRLCMSRWTQPLTTVTLDRFLEFVDVNETDADGRTALDYLNRNPNLIDAARYLISRGAVATRTD
ncbi:hypothetical protein N7486_005058 [Penicillium sp. IBT 16267x]|nr:hypothetical protein N7486_005058 [Penicillium sp. IBT 16267x]